MLAGAGRFDGSVKRKQVGLFGKVVDDLDDFSDVIGAVTEDVDDFRRGLNGLVGPVQAVGGLLHGLDAGDDLFAGAISDIEQDLGSVGDALNRGDHLVD